MRQRDDAVDLRVNSEGTDLVVFHDSKSWERSEAKQLMACSLH